MSTPPKPNPIFSGENRARLELDAKEIISRYPKARSALLPLLHLVQSEEGYVSNDGIAFCAEQLGLTTAEVTAVATFYTMYKRRPVGEYHVGVCTNPLCAVMGGDEIYSALKEHLGVENDGVTEDGKISLEHVECNAACDFAPVVMINWEFFDNQTPESAIEIVDKLRAGETVASPRGATITSWREAERVIAGFEDGRVDEGPAAGPASLAGLQIARERGWEAPPFQAEGPQSGRVSKSEAVAEADTRRAETETVTEQSAADVRSEETEATDD